MLRSKGIVIGFWIVSALFCLQIGFTAYAQLRFPQVSEAFTHLGFPAYFRVELSSAKLLGVALLLAPVPARLKEWAYAGFAITLGSALSPTSPWAMARRLGAGRRPPAWSGRSRTSSGAACRPRRRAPDRAVSTPFRRWPGCRDELSLLQGWLRTRTSCLKSCSRI